MPPSKPIHTIIGMVYDFDETLSPNNMQEDTIFRSYGIDKNVFWNNAQKLVAEKGYERTLAYLKLLIHDNAFKERPITARKLKESAQHIELFPGVEDYFDRVQGFLDQTKEVAEFGITVEHYIVSSGIREILEGTSIYNRFKRVYACSYEYNEKDHPVFPKLVINDTNKTQFLFRINKGKLDIDQDINSHMSSEDRRIPFENMVYIGDSTTDVPSMTVIKKYGGHSILVYNEKQKIKDDAAKIMLYKRAPHAAKANYQDNSVLMKIIRRTLSKIIQTIAYNNSVRMSQEWVEGSKIGK